MLTGKVDITSKFPKSYRPLSRRLYRVLEDIGVCTSARDMMIKTMTIREILLSAQISTLTRCNQLPIYTFGSSFEGTTTPGLKSDIDTVLVLDFYLVVTNLAEAQQHLSCLLLLQDASTPAGYSKLQLVSLGVPMTQSIISLFIPSNNLPTDGEDRLLLTLQHFPGLARHGPANTIEGNHNFRANDIVGAVRSCTWPECASEWLVRERHYNWPSREQIDKCKTLGCFFVHVGHPNSAEKHLQWRLSFSLQERLLVTAFNSLQLKCYVLLKMIKNEKIHKVLGEKSLSSYHFKTCMLYMIENTPAEFWTEENLLVCLHHCLQQMLVWTETGVCPNYFIPEENMFDGRVSGEMQSRVCKILKLILSADFKFLLEIETDKLGIRFRETLDSGIIRLRSRRPAFFRLMNYGCAVYQCLLDFRNSIFDRCQSTASQLCAQEICEVKQWLLRSNKVSEHSIAETREALSLLLPYVDITLMTVQIVTAKHMSASHDFIFSLLASERWHSASLEADPVSVKLKQASAMCMLAYCDLSLEILLGLQDRLEEKIPVCGCYGTATPNVIHFEKAIISACSYEESIHRHFIPCVVYLPAERDLTPPALCYEMDRSIGYPAEDKESWYNWAVVDGKVLFYFLLYLNHHHLGMEENALADIRSISRLLLTDSSIRQHKDTTANILGWIYKERGLADLAKMYFSLSLLLQPTHNAAFSHLQDISRVS